MYRSTDPDVLPNGRNLLKQVKLMLEHPEYDQPKVLAGAMELYRGRARKSWKKCIVLAFKVQNPPYSSYVTGKDRDGVIVAHQLLDLPREARRDYIKMRLQHPLHDLMERPVRVTTRMEEEEVGADERHKSQGGDVQTDLDEDCEILEAGERQVYVAAPPHPSQPGRIRFRINAQEGLVYLPNSNGDIVDGGVKVVVRGE